LLALDPIPGAPAARASNYPQTWSRFGGVILPDRNRGRLSWRPL
jgi:hypothetical protein